VIVRYLEYVVALAKERHFARAAAVCNVTQPTLSAGIKQLEEGLGVLIVERRQRFVGFTAEGERVLAWAHRVLADYQGLEQELSELREGLSGQIRIAAIPVTLPMIALLTEPLAVRYPRVRFQILSHTSVEIQRGLDDFTIDAAVTYLDNEPLTNVRSQPLYRERYVLISRAQDTLANKQHMTWAEASTLPLCLLTPNMQNRRIIDMHLRDIGAQAQPVIETNSLITLWSHVRFGKYATIVPHTFLLFLGKPEGLVSIPLIEPNATHLLGLVVAERDPLPPITKALLDIAREVDIAAAIEHHTAKS
jgi:DNA-binding transcriptional LysR family regulator